MRRSMMGVELSVRFQIVRMLLFAEAIVTATAVAAIAAPVADDSLVPYKIVDYAISTSLTGKPGDPAAGQLVVTDRKLGNCLGCHNMPISTEADQGTVGPDLHGVGKRYTIAQLRMRVVNMSALDPTTIMPSYYRLIGLRQVGKSFVNKPILSANQIEDVVAYLASVK